MKRLLLAFVVLLVSLLVACRPAAMPNHSSAADDVNSKTVALVIEDARLMPHAVCSGVWIGPNEILTANHCVEDGDVTSMRYASYGDVTIPDAKTTTAILRPLRFVKADEEHDLALLYAESPPPHAIVKLSKRDIAAGLPVQASGHPQGMWWSYSSGEVSGERYADLDLAMRWIFATAPIGPGSSGGGLFDEDGALLGICHGAFTRAQNLNVWIHRDHLAAFIGKR